MKEGKTGATANTPKNILFGAGTIHKGLKYSTTWNFAESLVGATSGGSKLSIIPEVTKVEVDGALVRAKGLDVKTGEVASMEVSSPGRPGCRGTLWGPIKGAKYRFDLLFLTWDFS